MKILILKPGGVGDTLLLFPAVVELRRNFQDAEIDIIGNREVLSLFVNNQSISKAISIEDSIVTEILSEKLKHRARNFLEQYDRLYLLIDDDGTIERNMKPLNISDYIIASSVQKNSSIPQWKFLTQIMKLNVSEHEDYIREFLKNRAIKKKRHILIHPGSGSKTKNWSLNNFIELIKYIRGRYNIELRVITGYAEKDIMMKLSNADNTIGDIEIHHNEKLSDIVDLLTGSYTFIGNDSGISHLAGLTGTASIVLFGPSDPRIWKPIGDDITILIPENNSANAENISLRSVIEEFDKLADKFLQK
jgi:heptosyltransferase-3